MANRNDYTITTLSSSIRQFDPCTRNNAIVAPFGKATNTANNLKIRYNTPYIAGPLNPPETGSVYTPPVTSYAVPFSYYQFDVSGSQYVTNVLGQNNYTGSFSGTTGPYGGGTSYFGFDNTYVFTGSYAVRFPQDFSSNFVDLGTPSERSNWSTLLSGSFSISTWIYLEWDSGNAYRYNYTKFFSQRINNSNVGFAFGTYRGQPMFYSYGGPGGGGTQSLYTQWGNASSTNFQGWNHFVFVVDGDTDATNRRVRAYINNTDFGYADDTVTGRYYQKYFKDDEPVAWGASGVGSWNARMAMDESSIWDYALTSADVSALYNSGTGSYAIGLIESGSTGGC